MGCGAVAKVQAPWYPPGASMLADLCNSSQLAGACLRQIVCILRYHTVLFLFFLYLSADMEKFQRAIANFSADMEKFQRAIANFFERFVQAVNKHGKLINGVIALLVVCKLSSKRGCSIVGTDTDPNGKLCAHSILQSFGSNMTGLLTKQSRAARESFDAITVSTNFFGVY